MNRSWVLSCLVALTGCGTQVTEDYPGEALANVQGTLLVGDAPAPTGGLDVGIIYGVPGEDGDSDRFGGYSVEVTGDFPAQFDLALYEPPPPDALFPISEGERSTEDFNLAIGLIVTGDPGSLTDPQNVQPTGMFDGLRGAAARHMLIYVDRDVPSDHVFAQQFTGGAITAGYHLVERSAGEALPNRYRCPAGGPDPFACEDLSGDERTACEAAYREARDEWAAENCVPERAVTLDIVDGASIEVVLGETPPTELLGIED